MKIPGSHQTIMPYLIVDGAEKFIDFTKSVFNAEEIFKRMREDGRTVMHEKFKSGAVPLCSPIQPGSINHGRPVFSSM